MIQNKSKGFTLLELILTLLISSLLFLFCNHANKLLTALSNESDAHRFLNNLTFARYAAIKANQLVTVCPTLDQQHCSDDWSKGYMIFHQPIHKDEPIHLLRYEKNNHLTRIDSHQTLLLQFSGDGRSLHRATFGLDARKPYRIVVYDSGRIRLSCDS
jgi:prepilin-type N-terminal cleavage/methylation domain-containing protein